MMNRVLLALGRSELISTPVRRRLLSATGMKLSKTCEVLPGSRFASNTVSVGGHTFINRDCFYDGGAPLSIGAECAVGYKVVFCTITHERGDERRRSGRQVTRPIMIGDGCWIGANVLILPGVTIGQGCIIGAGAVVRTACEPNSTYVGVPARRIGPADPVLQP